MSTANPAEFASQFLVGHHRQREWFRNAIRSRRLASTFLFVGPEGIGKRTFALFLAKSVFCERVPPEELNPCGLCPSCIQVSAGTHPDILQVGKPEDRAVIPVELLIGSREARMQEGLCHDIRLRPMNGDRRIAILDDCDVLNTEGANALLKTLEEPPAKSLIFLIGTSLQRQLPTIRSRCQVVRFDAPEGEEAIEVLRRRCMQEEIAEEAIEPAMRLANGDMTKATMFLHDEYREFSEQFSRLLDEDPPEAISIAKLLASFIESAGADASKKRDRLRMASSLAAHFYRDQIRDLALTQDVSQPTTDTEPYLYRLQRSMDVRYQVDRNVNQATLIESWSYDLQRGTHLQD